MGVDPVRPGDPFAPISALPGPFRKGFAIFLLGFGGVVALGCVLGEVLVLRAYLAFPESPRRVALEAARPNEWVALTDAVLECESRREIGNGTYFLGRSLGGRYFVASYNQPMTCEGAHSLIGTVGALHPNLARTLARNSFALPDGEIAQLCTWCGPRNDLIGSLVLAAGILLGAFLAWVGLTERRKLREGR